jgi:hypothetical protein
MTLTELAKELDERGVAIQIRLGFGGVWVVWLFADDDPAIFFLAEDESLEIAVTKSFDQWDQASKEADLS